MTAAFRPDADLCATGLHKAREQIMRQGSRRAGLVATNSIRGGANREVLETNR